MLTQFCKKKKLKIRLKLRKLEHFSLAPPTDLAKIIAVCAPTLVRICSLQVSWQYPRLSRAKRCGRAFWLTNLLLIQLSLGRTHKQTLLLDERSREKKRKIGSCVFETNYRMKNECSARAKSYDWKLFYYNIVNFKAVIIHIIKDE